MHVDRTDHRIAVHVPPDLRAAIERAAEADGRPVADYIRRTLAAHLGVEPPRVKRGPR
jgi:uncharacterized protein (DUF1778 family)